MRTLTAFLFVIFAAVLLPRVLAISAPVHAQSGEPVDVAAGGSIVNIYSDGDIFFRGELIEVKLYFFEDDVNLFFDTSGGLPTVDIEIGGRIRKAHYSAAASSSGQPIFQYTVQADDYDDDGLVWVPAGSLIVPHGSSITNQDGNRVRIIWEVSSGSHVIVDGRRGPTPTHTPTRTHTPIPTNTPVHTQHPTPEMVKPTEQTAITATQTAQTQQFQPFAIMHISTTELTLGDPPARVSLSAHSPQLANGNMTATLDFAIPSGMVVSERFREYCSGGLCSKHASDIPPGVRVDVVIEVEPRQAGTFRIEGRTEWYLGDRVDPIDSGTLEHSTEVTVWKPPPGPSPTRAHPPTPTHTPTPTRGPIPPPPPDCENLYDKSKCFVEDHLAPIATMLTLFVGLGVIWRVARRPLTGIFGSINIRYKADRRKRREEQEDIE